MHVKQTSKLSDWQPGKTGTCRSSSIGRKQCAICMGCGFESHLRLQRGTQRGQGQRLGGKSGTPRTRVVNVKHRRIAGCWQPGKTGTWMRGQTVRHGTLTPASQVRPLPHLPGETNFASYYNPANAYKLAQGALGRRSSPGEDLVRDEQARRRESHRDSRERPAPCRQASKGLMRAFAGPTVTLS